MKIWYSKDNKIQDLIVLKKISSDGQEREMKKKKKKNALFFTHMIPLEKSSRVDYNCTLKKH